MIGWKAWLVILIVLGMIGVMLTSVKWTWESQSTQSRYAWAKDRLIVLIALVIIALMTGRWKF